MDKYLLEVLLILQNRLLRFRRRAFISIEKQTTKRNTPSLRVERKQSSN
ncbi:MAG: hypothetical protein LBT04_07035 [Prevotellaceae bacterium]|nr:hypothetical protein [Prevotellaceae bacterium]